MNMECHETSVVAVTALVYVSLLLDNLLLSAVVPIIPAFLNDSRYPGAKINLDNFDDESRSLTSQTLLLHRILANISSPMIHHHALLSSRTSVFPVVNFEEEAITVTSKPAGQFSWSKASNSEQKEPEYFKRAHFRSIFPSIKSNAMLGYETNLRTLRDLSSRTPRDIIKDHFKVYSHRYSSISNDKYGKLKIKSNGKQDFPKKIPTDILRTLNRRYNPSTDIEIYPKKTASKWKRTGDISSEFPVRETAGGRHKRDIVPSVTSPMTYTDEPERNDSKSIQREAADGLKGSDKHSSRSPPGVVNMDEVQDTCIEQEHGGSIGLLLSSKAFVQLFATFLVGSLVERVGFRLPLVCGVAILSLSAFMFACAGGYWSLFLARSVHGIGSSCIAISGLTTVAAQYPDEKQRSSAMGRVLGGMALGVLMGYPYGGLLYDFSGKTLPMVLLALVLALVFALQYIQLRPLYQSFNRDEFGAKSTKMAPLSTWWFLLCNRRVVIVIGAVGLSTSVMAVLEPTLPVWLMDTIHPQEWKLGSVFIPDSLGYLVGTHMFATVTLRVGRWRCAAAALLIVGAATLLLPQSTRMVHLVLPHFCVGLGIGIVDTALMPLLARVVETTNFNDYESSSADVAVSGADPQGSVGRYGIVYAISQSSVCLAYSLGPLLGGYFSANIGFKWVMYTLGLLNLLYSPTLVLLREQKYSSGQMVPQETARWVRPPPLPCLKLQTINYSQMSEDRS